MSKPNWKETLDLARTIESAVDIPDQSDFLMHYAMQAKEGILEIGAWMGRSSVILAEAARANSVRMVVVDTWVDCDIGRDKDFYPIWLQNMQKRGFSVPESKIVQVLRMPSVEAAASAWMQTAQRDAVVDYPTRVYFDLAFIDADHSYESVKSDFEAWLPYFDSDAVVIFHNVESHPGPKQLFDELKAKYFTRERGNIGAITLHQFQEEPVPL